MIRLVRLVIAMVVIKRHLFEKNRRALKRNSSFSNMGRFVSLFQGCGLKNINNDACKRLREVQKKTEQSKLRMPD